MLFKKNVFALIVTYSDRFKFLKQVVDSCFEVGVKKVFIVDNNSKENSKIKLQQLEENNKDKISVIYLDENIGSSGGYKIGLQKITTNEDCDFIWLLDDDNVPQNNSLNELKIFWNSLNINDKSSNVSLLSFRKDREVYREAILKNYPNLVLGEKNSFLGFHLSNLPHKIIDFFIAKKSKKKSIPSDILNSGLVTVAPYGGMFFNKKLIANIGYPNEKFFLYADDHEWSYRITKNNGSIYLVLSSELTDIDTSWNIKKDRKTIFSNIANGNHFRIYYSVRNRVFFERTHLVNNHFIYKLNILVFKGLLLLIGGVKKSTLKIFNASIKDGIEGKLGKNEYYSN